MIDFASLKNPVVMGILNITPDSFSDGGELFSNHQKNLNLILKRAIQMQADGALILDVGGESTRPGASVVSVQEEMDRVIPVINAIRKESHICISVDTSKAEVMVEAIKAGANIINDVYALQKEKALQAAADQIKKNKDIKICLMHMQNNPQTMQENPTYGDVVREVVDFLAQRITVCELAGIDKASLLVDPGFGFGKTLQHNVQLIRQLSEMSELGCPVLVGVSRKKMIGQLTGSEDPKDRLSGSLALAWACAQRGAKILRVHDVKETVDSLKVFKAVQT